MAEISPKQKKGLFLTVLYALLAICLIFLIGFDYKLIDYRWTWQSPWRHLAGVCVGCAVVVFCSIFLSFAAFKTAMTPLLLCFLIFQGLSMLFSFGTAVMSFMASAPGSIDEYIGCHSPFKGFVEMWDSIDHYLIAADQLHCSTECPCSMNADVKAKFQKNAFVNNLITKESWKIGGTNKMLQDCTGVHTKLKNHFTQIDNDKYGVLVKDFDNDAFMKFWANMESRFNCTGWCTTSYDYNSELVSRPLNTQGFMMKFVFNDINSGIPRNIGCMSEFIKYTKRMVKTYSSCLIIVCFFQILTFVLAIGLLCEKRKPKTVPDEEKPKEVGLDENKA